MKPWRDILELSQRDETKLNDWLDKLKRRHEFCTLGIHSPVSHSPNCSSEEWWELLWHHPEPGAADQEPGDGRTRALPSTWRYSQHDIVEQREAELRLSIPRQRRASGSGRHTSHRNPGGEGLKSTEGSGAFRWRCSACFYSCGARSACLAGGTCQVTVLMVVQGLTQKNTRMFLCKQENRQGNDEQ